MTFDRKKFILKIFLTILVVLDTLAMAEFIRQRNWLLLAAASALLLLFLAWLFNNQ